MNPSSVIQNGHKTRLASKLEDVVFPLTHLCEIEPVSSRTLLEQFKKAHRFFCLFICFSWDGQQRSWPCIHICMRCRSNHKIVVKNHTKLTTAIGLYMNSFTRERTERTRTYLKLALAVTNLVDLGYHMRASLSKGVHVALSQKLLKGLKIQHQLSSLCLSRWPNRETKITIEKNSISLKFQEAKYCSGIKTSFVIKKKINKLSPYYHFAHFEHHRC